MAVGFLEAGLVHVRVGVLSPVAVGVRVLVGHVVVLMRGVRMRVSHLVVVVFVRMRRFVGVLFGHGFLLLA